MQLLGNISLQSPCFSDTLDLIIILLNQTKHEKITNLNCKLS